MANAEIIGLLCAGSTRYHELGRSSNREHLSRAELAGMLAGLSDTSMHLALAKYAIDQDAERLLIAHMRMLASGVAVREKWQVVKGRPTIVNMSALAVFEVVRPNRCSRCHGRGILGMKTCLCCDGTGYKTLSRRKIAEAIGIDESNYRRLWKSRYDKLFSYLQGLDADIYKVLHNSDRLLSA